MNYNWNEIEWIFENDGSLRDIYVQDTSINDWIKLIDLFNSNYRLKFGYDGEDYNKINKDEVIQYFSDKEGKLERKSLNLDLNGIRVNCYFFLEDQIEFDIDPGEIKSIKDYEIIETFMINISTALNNQIALTFENDIKCPLIKIDVLNKTNKIISIKELNKILEKNVTIKNKINNLKMRFIFKYCPFLFKRKVLKSANEVYLSTSKKENIW